jgi:hypothetical protein
VYYAFDAIVNRIFFLIVFALVIVKWLEVWGPWPAPQSLRRAPRWSRWPLLSLASQRGRSRAIWGFLYKALILLFRTLSSGPNLPKGPTSPNRLLRGWNSANIQTLSQHSQMKHAHLKYSTHCNFLEPGPARWMVWGEFLQLFQLVAQLAHSEPGRKAALQRLWVAEISQGWQPLRNEVCQGQGHGRSHGQGQRK